VTAELKMQLAVLVEVLREDPEVPTLYFRHLIAPVAVDVQRSAI
jgi:hypothetical protein